MKLITKILFTLTAFLTLAASANAASITLTRSPAPPETVLNDGTQSISYNYTMTWESNLTAKARQVRIWQGAPGAAGSVILQDSGQLATANTPNPFISPTGTWTPPAGTTAGNYYVEAILYTNQSCTVAVCDPDLDFEARASVQFGVSSATGNITVRKFEDMNGNGLRDPNEPGVANWPFQIVAPNANLVGTTSYNKSTTGAGTFTMNNVPASAAGASYTISEILPNPNTDRWAATTATDQTVSLKSGQNTTVEFGNVRQTYLCGTTWEDTNGNGKKDANEPVFPNVKVNLGGKDGRGNPVTGTKTTGTDGRYCFGPLMPGTYQVLAETPASYQATWDKDGSANSNVLINPIDLTSGQPSDGNDFAFYKPTPIKPPVDPPVVPPTPTPQTKICINKKVNLKKVRQGKTVTWTMRITNCGTNPAKDVAIIDPLFGDTTLTNRGSATLVRGSLVWSIGDMAVGQSKTVTFKTRFDRDARIGTHTNRVRGEASNAPTVTSNASTKVYKVKRKPKKVAVTG